MIKNEHNTFSPDPKETIKKNKFTSNVSQNQLDKIIDILGKKIKIS